MGLLLLAIGAGWQPAPPPVQAPQPSGSPDSKTPQPEDVGATKIQVPAPAELKKAEGLIREVLSAEFAAAKTPAQKQALAARLIALALETEDDPAARFMLGMLARDLAAEAGDLTAAWEAIQVLEKHFLVEGPKLKAELFERLLKETRAAGPSEATLTFVEGALVAAREAALSGKTECVSRLISAVQTISKRIEVAPIRQEISQHIKAIETLAASWKRFLEAKNRLELAAAESQAHTTVGLWLCLIQGDWPIGLKHLSASDQPSLAALAAQELKYEQLGGDPLPLAEGWFQEVERLEFPFRQAALLRARAHFESAGAADPELLKRWQPRLDLALQAELALYPFQYGVVTQGNVASLEAGVQVVGRGAMPGLVDGVIPPIVGAQGMAVAPWPCEWTVVLRETYRLREIRLKLPDPGKFVQFFVLSTSPDGRNFFVLADHSKVPSAGWQRFIFLARPVKAIRIQGISHTGDQNFYVSELEAYCTAPAPWVIRGTATSPQLLRPRRGPRPGLPVRGNEAPASRVSPPSAPVNPN
ncbi:MAG: discoidin domain-containing protein [Thermoguttaceae bacterium]|nr:discoidin domain-containing protein [Thermoguttaceae bacterium]MDW8078381.1 hypothetical protein [Thermoguttaceae bacterium]